MRIEQQFIVDRLTDSIRNTISGDSFQTEISTLKSSEINIVSKKTGWNFDWESEFKDLAKEVYKLTIINNPEIIQGLLSISVENDHIFMNLLESAPFNIGKRNFTKVYQVIWSLMLARFHFKKVMMAL